MPHIPPDFWSQWTTGIKVSTKLLLLAVLLVGCFANLRTQSEIESSKTDSPLPNESKGERSEEAGLCNGARATETANWYDGAVGYEVFVRSFYDHDGDGIGDLKGLVEKLDYLNDGDPSTNQDLGVTLLWLMPVSNSPSYHGYDVTDYRGVNPEYGSGEDLKELVSKAHARGIRVILDLVLNHTSDQHPWFLDSRDSASHKRDWYVWSGEELNWPTPWNKHANTWHPSGNSWYYGVFWSGMPDLNFNNTSVVGEMLDTAIYWAKEYGVDGYRLDAVRYIVETGPGEGQQDTSATIDFWKAFSSQLRKQFPEMLLLGEAWASNSIASKYLADGNGLGKTFDFDLMESLIAGLNGEEPADIEAVLCSWGDYFPAGATPSVFLGNHDLIRASSRLKGDSDKLALGAFLLFTLPGLPFVYYGEEIGMTNGATPDDKHKRTPMQWSPSENAGFSSAKPWLPPNSNFTSINVAAQDGDPTSLLALYRALIRLRSAHISLSSGGFEPVAVKSSSGARVWGFLRQHKAETAVCVANFSQGMDAGHVEITLPSKTSGKAKRLWPKGGDDAQVEGDILEAGEIPALDSVCFIMP